MNITYVGKKTVVRDSFKTYAEKKLRKLEKLFDEDPAVTVVVTNEPKEERVEVTIKTGGMFFRAEKCSEDRTNSLDLAVDALTNQIVRNKSKLQKRFKDGVIPDFSDFTEDPAMEEVALVKTKKFYVGVMDVEEAILQMNMLGHSFFMFRNGDSGEVNVVYRRKDGNYGLLEPIQD